MKPFKEFIFLIGDIFHQLNKWYTVFKGAVMDLDILKCYKMRSYNT